MCSFKCLYTLAVCLTKRLFGSVACFPLLLVLSLIGYGDEASLAVQPKVLVQEFVFVGNTIFTDEELSEIAAPYMQQELASEKLLELKNKLTQHYIDHGYINSGAMLPDQEIENGIIRYEIKEGTLQEVRLLQKGHFNPHYLLSRINRGAFIKVFRSTIIVLRV